MTNNLRGKERENDLIGNILHDGTFTFPSFALSS